MTMPGPHTDARCWTTEVSRDNAINGSSRLSDAMRKQFLRFAARHGVTVTDARLLLMNGVGL